MNRSFFNVILGGWGATEETGKTSSKEQNLLKVEIRRCSLFNENASSVIIVPSYGMAVAQAQHALREMVDALKKMVESYLCDSSSRR